MALARIQASIVKNLLKMGHLSETQCQTIIDTDEDLSGVELELLLFEEYKTSPFQVLVAKAQAFGLPPINVKHCLVNELTFAKLEQDFCRENAVLPLGFAGDFVIVAVSNPFDLEVINKVKEMSGMPVSVLLGLESAINDALRGDEEERQAVGFGDVVEALGMDFESDEDAEEDDD